MSVRLKAIADQVIVITGASSGIGLATAKMAAAAGARVFIVARAEDVLAKIVADIEADGGTAAFHAADVGDEAAMRAAAAAAVQRFGRIDTWVNCAGVAIYAALIDTPFAEHERLFRTNYFGAVNGSLAAIPQLREHGGALITVGSIAGDMPSPVMGAYAASKHAVKGFVESLRIELNAERAPIAVTLVKPSGIDTPIAGHAANHVGGEALVPPPVYDPDLVARAILDAARHTRDNVTVGGVGRLQVLVATHAPRLFARFGGLAATLMVNPDRPPSPRDNLEAPVDGGRVRSRHQSGRSVSLYGGVRQRRAWLAVGGLAVAAFALHRRRGWAGITSPA